MENPGVNIGPWGDDSPDVLLKREHEELLSARRYVEIPSNMQQRVDYGVRTDGQPEYVGFGPRGLAASASGWLIHKFTYTVISSTDFLSYRSIGYGIWDNRASVTYA